MVGGGMAFGSEDQEKLRQEDNQLEKIGIVLRRQQTAKLRMGLEGLGAWDELGMR